ncbi:MAG: hypothetical protein ACI8RD_004060 [Bacillariaceae sp.]|jgi:hypothetical protein
MNNLMGDVPAWAADSDSDDGGGDDNAKWNNNGSGGGDIEMQKSKEDDNQYMSTFFSEVDGINADIKAISQASKEIGSINEQSMRATTTAEEQKLSKKLGPLIGSTNKRAKRTKDLLGLLKQETDKLKDEGKLNASNVRYVLVLYCIFFLFLFLLLLVLRCVCNTVPPILPFTFVKTTNKCTNFLLYLFLIIFVTLLLLLLLLLLFQLIDKQCTNIILSFDSMKYKIKIVSEKI